MGKKSRDKGAAFECLIKNTILAAFPDAKVFRTLQADRAHQSDVHVAAGPGALPRLWIECHHGKTAINAKRSQARNDAIGAGRGDAIAIVIWRRTRAREVNVSLGLRDLVHLRMNAGLDHGTRDGNEAHLPYLPGDDDLVTLTIEAFLRLVA